MGFAVNGTQRLLIYELLSGGDVSKRLQRCARDGSPFSYQQRLSVALDAACGLSHLHNSIPKVFHRDIKTPNILLDRNGGAKMADFGLACLSRSTEHKVKQASATIGYACPFYIQKGIVTEGSEVYSFGMVLIELLCNAPPACPGSSPGEILYLVNHLQGSVSRLLAMVDAKAGWPGPLAQRMGDLAMNCISMTESNRPKFVQIVKLLRGIIENSDPAGGGGPAHQTAIPVSPPKKPQMIELFKLECLQPVGQRIIHSVTSDEMRSESPLPPLKVGRHVQGQLFDSVVTSDTLKGTISRDHFHILLHDGNLNLMNNSINSISINNKIIIEKYVSPIQSNDETTTKNPSKQLNLNMRISMGCACHLILFALSPLCVYLSS
jgi:serine/threonine protein kinase